LQKSDVEWAIHEPLARKVGLAAETLDALSKDERPTFGSDEERAIYDYCAQLHCSHTVDEKTLHQLIETLGAKAAVCYYTMVAMTLNAFGVGEETETKKKPAS
jgi:4-carboxymuconolactone decarboxylase